MSEYRFPRQDPPPKKAGFAPKPNRRLQAFVDQCRASPGVWYRYDYDAASRSVHTKPFPQLEMTSRIVRSSTQAPRIEIYGRWVDEGEG